MHCLLEAYCQCTLLESSEEAPVPSPSKGPSASFKQESPCKDSPQKMEQSSSDYRPSSTSAEEDSSYEEESSYEEDAPTIPKRTSQSEAGEDRERVFLVMESCLLTLFRLCLSCKGPITASVEKVVGTLLRVAYRCHNCGATGHWDSQTFIGGKVYCDVMLSASILFAGATPTKVLRVLCNLNCPTIGIRTFMRHQRHLLQPTIRQVWNTTQKEMLQRLVEIGMPMILGGDGRHDSAGHSAKYGSYSFMDFEWNMIVHLELVQSNEVTSSNAMELEGLKRGLKYLQERGINVETLISDRHRSIAKYMREQQPDIDHFYDVWHVAKGLSKKIDQLAKKKTCTAVGEWSKSISNHLYWVAASTSDGDGEVMLAKWQSVTNHIQNVHTHDSELFPKCQHGNLSLLERKCAINNENSTTFHQNWLKIDHFTAF
ncbi:uncharacterized protein [Apostichopus japonicus]|uniref:uncharacterized protein isoform X1 n=2 Tax=Stichopus japonicus TaxID=307972 RepID=UPI003AB7F622